MHRSSLCRRRYPIISLRICPSHSPYLLSRWMTMYVQEFDSICVLNFAWQLTKPQVILVGNPESSSNLPFWLSWRQTPSNGNFILICFILLLPILTHCVSTWRFQRSSSVCDHDVLISPPVIPYWNIFVGHLFDLAWDTTGFVKKAV